MPNQTNRRMARFSWVAAIVGLFFVGATLADTLDSAVQTEENSNQSTRQSQERINNLSDQAEDLASEYSRVIRETEALNVYNDALKEQVKRQEAELESINAQLERLENTNRGVVPLLDDMIDMLERIVEADLPFRKEERVEAVARLRDELYRADVTTSEKYRRVMEAYQREIEFGRNASVYEGKLPGTDRTVTFLKVGRTLLYYQTLDGETSGWWKDGAYVELEDKYNSGLTRAIRIANNQEAPNLVRLPVPAAGAAQ